MPEFTRLVRLDQIGEAPREERIEADDTERAALARRFDLVGIGRLSATAALRREGAGVIADGSVAAEVVQRCVATGLPVSAVIQAPIRLRFLPEEAAAGAGDELELDAADCDTLPFSGGAIDLGEAVAETLALALDPYPRSPGADAALAAAGVIGEESAGPFAGLAGLRERIDRPH